MSSTSFQDRINRINRNGPTVYVEPGVVNEFTLPDVQRGKARRHAARNLGLAASILIAIAGFEVFRMQIDPAQVFDLSMRFQFERAQAAPQIMAAYLMVLAGPGLLVLTNPLRRWLRRTRGFLWGYGLATAVLFAPYLAMHLSLI